MTPPLCEDWQCAVQWFNANEGLAAWVEGVGTLAAALIALLAVVLHHKLEKRRELARVRAAGEARMALARTFSRRAITLITSTELLRQKDSPSLELEQYLIRQFDQAAFDEAHALLRSVPLMDFHKAETAELVVRLSAALRGIHLLLATAKNMVEQHQQGWEDMLVKNLP